MLQQFLIIGLGGSGGKTLRYLKQALEERFREIGWEEGMPDGWQLLHIDTPVQQDSPVLPGAPDLLEADEYLGLARPGIDLAAMVDSLERRGRDFGGWLFDSDYMRIPIEAGAGQYRAVGRVLGLFHADEIQRRIRMKKQALLSAGAMAQLRQLAERASGLSLASESAATPAAIVVSSLAGGTGAGIVMDVCDILRAEGDSWMDESIGILYSADVFVDLSEAASRGVYPNTAAALAEILHGYYGDGGFIPPGGGQVQQRSGPAFPYLVGHTNTKGVSFGDQLAAYRFMARCLAAVMTDRRMQDDFTVYMKANWQSSAGSFPTHGAETLMLPDPPKYFGAIQALGFAEVDLGVGRLGTYAEQRFTRDAVEFLRGAYVKAARKRPRYENQTTEEIVEDLAEDAFTRFLKTSGINERGRDNNQVLDSIGLPDVELDAIFRDVADRVRYEASEEVGSKARTQRWADCIVEGVEVRRAGVLKKLDDRLRDEALKWVERITDRIVQVVGTNLADYGAQIALRLLAKADAEMANVAEELESERQEELAWAGHLRSDVLDAIGMGLGALPADHEGVRNAISKAIQTGLVHPYNAAHRLIASRLVADLRDGVVQPLRDAIERGYDALRQAVEADRSEAGSTPIDDWPRHHPASDRLVPEALEPGASTMLVIDPADFPRLFEKHTMDSTGAEGLEEAWIQVRRTVITGESEQSTMEPWILTNSRWSAPEWLTVGDAAPRRASFTVRISRDDLLARARAWLRTDGSAWKESLTLGLRGYLSDSLPPAVRAPREQRFRKSLAKAFEAAEPLVSVDRELVQQVHSGLDLRIRPVTSPIPVAGLPVEPLVREYLLSRLDRDAEMVEQTLNQSERETRVAIYTSLGGALHPMCFDSLTKPITDAWRKEKDTSNLVSFWNARRSRALSRATPIPRPMLRALIRGWFIGRMLGLVELEVNTVALATERGVSRFEPMLPLRGQPWAVLASLIEGLCLALPAAADRKDAERFLGPYSQLLEWGRSHGAVGPDLKVFPHPSPVLSTWLRTGTTPSGREAVVTGMDPPSRRQEATELLEQQIGLYRRQAEEDRRSDNSARNAWLGIADLITEEIANIVRCLRADASGRRPSL